MADPTRTQQEVAQLTRLFDQACTEHLAPFGYVRSTEVAPAPRLLGCVVAFDSPRLNGSLSVCAPAAFVERTHPLTGRAHDARELGDWMGELCNRLLGRFKTLCLGQGLDFSVGIPRVVDGDRLRPSAPAAGTSVQRRLSCGSDSIDAWIDVHMRIQGPLFEATTDYARTESQLNLGQPSARPRTGKKILIVDDSRTVRQEVKAVLNEAGFEVIEAVDGLNGLDLIARHDDLALVICDINMPRLNGIKLLEEVKQRGKNAVPVLVLTTESAASLIAKAKQTGAVAWMLKPFKRDQLVASVRKITGS